jgi:hypothetical protein
VVDIAVFCVRRNKLNLENYTIKNLLKLHSEVINELRHRNVLRTHNNPVGDYTEWLVAKCLKLNLESNSSSGFDALDDKDVRYQIKGRRITPNNKSRQLGVIRNLNQEKFDILVAVIFDAEYEIIEAVLIPQEIIADYAKFSPLQNGHILHLKGPILSDKKVTNINNFLKS